MVREAKKIVVFFSFITLFIFFCAVLIERSFHILSSVFAFIVLFLVYFFRDPQRIVKIDQNVFYSPADDRIFEIEEKMGYYCVKIFMSIFDVHIQKVPIDCIRLYSKEGRIQKRQI